MLDITDNDVYNGLAGFINLIVPNGTPIQRGQQNRVPMPNVDCVIMTTLGASYRIGTNENSTVSLEYTSDSNVTADSNIPSGSGYGAAVTADFRYDIQVDFYSQYAESWAMAAELLWRDNIGFAVMPAGMKPLYSEGRQQLPIIGAENQWINRWTMTLTLDYQPSWVQTTQAADTATVIPEPIDVFFPATTVPVLATDAGQIIETDLGQPILVD